jgi:HPt (histidine-containing phosphotransfer) domain-containing protein
MNAPEADIIDRHFEGDRALYNEYKSLCQAQFPLDVQAGDAACAAQDVHALQRLAHSLKTVLRSLGHDALGDLASHIEQQAANGSMLLPEPNHWSSLREQLLVLASTPPSPHASA